MKNINEKMPKYNDLINPTFKALKELGGSGNTNEINAKVIEMENYSENLLSEMQNEYQSKIEYRIARARSDLKKYGVVDNTARRVWVIKKEYENEESIDLKEIKRNFLPTNSSETKIDIDELKPEEEWKIKLKNILNNMNPFAFEKLTQLLLRESGFSEVEVTKKTGDGGIDGYGILKINEIISFKLAFQCKRYKGIVSPKEIRDFRGSMTTDIEKGLFITTGIYSRAAIKEAEADGKKRIDLINGEELLNKLAELQLGIKEEKVYVIDEEFFQNFK